MKNVADVYPLTPVQEGMLFHTLSAPGLGIYLTQISFLLEGELDVTRLERAWQETVQAHPALRTAFLWEGLDKPLQVVRETVSLSITRLPHATHEQIEAFLEADRTTDFVLERAPLLRLHLFQLGPEAHRLVWSFHHLLSDGWSTPLILNDVFQRYHHEFYHSSSPPYRNYIDWLEDEDTARHEVYWRNTLNGFSQPLACPRTRTGEGSDGPIRMKHVLSRRDTEAIQAFCREHRLTWNTLVLGAWMQTLSAWCGQSDTLVGTTVSGRPPGLPDVEMMVGNFINTLPVRSEIDSTEPVIDWLNALQGRLTELREHEHVPLTQIQKWSAMPAGQNLFESIFVFESSTGLPEPDGLTLSDWDHREQSHYPLAALAIPGDVLTLLFIADGTVHGESGLAPVLECWAQVIKSIVEQKSITWLGPGMAKQVLHDWNATTAVPTPSRLLSLSEIPPENIAVVCGDQRLTYGLLDSRSNQFANHLIAQGICQGHRVGVLCQRGVDMLIAIFGVLKSGAAYVPLDPSYPPPRLESMIKEAGIKHLCSQLELLGTVDLSNLTVIVIDDDSPGRTPATPPSISAQPSDLAYVIFTSGSSGTPRGVEVTHANLWHSTHARLDYYEKPVEAFLLLSSFAFDSSAAGIFWTLCQGGKLCLLPESDQYNPASMAELIRDESITHLLGVPSLVDVLLTESRAPHMASLHTTIVAGETCPPALVVRHHALLPHSSLVNEYGPTEATVWATAHRCSPGDSPVPIGNPIRNTQVYVLDRRQRPLPVGFPGELCIGGAGVTSGYINDPVATKERFIENSVDPTASPIIYRTGDKARWRTDGKLEFLGRLDSQIQLYGLRIELEEIENALRTHPAVSDAVVSLQPSPVSIDSLSQALASLPTHEAEALLGFEDHTYQRTLSAAAYEFQLTVSDPSFVRPPRKAQRQWLINQALHEFRDDLEHLNEVSKRFVSGATDTVQEYDIAERALTDDEIMEDWQTPVMDAMAEQITRSHGDILEIGFGRGVSAEFIQSKGVRSHTIIESNANSIDQHFRPWRERHADRDITMIHSRWQDALEALGTYDGVFFHAFPLNEEEFIETVVQSITFAEHFFPTAAKLLRPGGVFTYLTTEIDSMSRRHQRALFQHFTGISMTIQKVSVPANTRDTWWADSMVIVRAEK